MITYLRARTAAGVELPAITPVLSAALAAATASGNRLHQLQLLALTAWQQWRLHDTAAARATLRDAALLAQETGYVRVLLDIPDLAPLLQELRIPRAHSPLPAPNGPAALTAQELRVLKLLAADYTYGQIGVALVLSIGTVRTHVRHIYKKLGVHRRDQAIAAAQRRGLLHR